MALEELHANADAPYLYLEGPLYEELREAAIYTPEGTLLGTLGELLAEGFRKTLPGPDYRYLPLRGSIPGDAEAHWSKLLPRWEAYKGGERHPSIRHDAYDALSFLNLLTGEPHLMENGADIPMMLPGVFGLVFDDFMHRQGSGKVMVRLFIQVDGIIYQAFFFIMHADPNNLEAFKVGESADVDTSYATVSPSENVGSVVTQHYHISVGMKRLGKTEEVRELMANGTAWQIHQDPEMTATRWNDLAQDGEMVFFDAARIMSPEDRDRIFIIRDSEDPVLIHLGLESSLYCA